MPRTTASAAPELSPRMPGSAIGLRVRPWRTTPAERHGRADDQADDGAVDRASDDRRRPPCRYRYRVSASRTAPGARCWTPSRSEAATAASTTSAAPASAHGSGTRTAPARVPGRWGPVRAGSAAATVVLTRRASPLTAETILGRKSCTAVVHRQRARQRHRQGDVVVGARDVVAVLERRDLAEERVLLELLGAGAVLGVEDDDVGGEGRGLLGREVGARTAGSLLSSATVGESTMPNSAQHLRAQVGGRVEADRRQVGRGEPGPRGGLALDLRVRRRRRRRWSCRCRRSSCAASVVLAEGLARWPRRWSSHEVPQASSV